MEPPSKTIWWMVTTNRCVEGSQEKSRAQKRTVLKIEGAAHFGGGLVEDVPFRRGVGHRSAFVDVKAEIDALGDDGHGQAARHRKARPKRVVALNDDSHALLERCDV